MKILVVGDISHLRECQQKLAGHDYLHAESAGDASRLLDESDVIFDFLINDNPDTFRQYSAKPVTLFANTWLLTLGGLCHAHTGAINCTVFGFNGFPTMFNRQFLEVSLLKRGDVDALKKICAQLKTEFLVVDDRVGFVTPRVICMIINEAYFTVQEGTATREDIDLAMKLGTNYPFGPFEWCKKIGLQHVYRLLEAVHDDTKDERYKISALMKKEYLGVSHK